MSNCCFKKDNYENRATHLDNANLRNTLFCFANFGLTQFCTPRQIQGLFYKPRWRRFIWIVIYPLPPVCLPGSHSQTVIYKVAIHKIDLFFTVQGHSKSQGLGIAKLHHWIKGYGNFYTWVDFHWKGSVVSRTSPFFSTPE